MSLIIHSYSNLKSLEFKCMLDKIVDFLEKWASDRKKVSLNIFWRKVRS